MIILITGATHSGKTRLAQEMMEVLHIPYLSVDHLKMGLIRSGNISLTPCDDEELGTYLWPIVREIIKTAVENHQHMIIEGLYIPLDWKQDFDEIYRKEIHCCCIILSETYIISHFSDIRSFADVIEKRLNDTSCTMESLLKDNEKFLKECKEHDVPYIMIENSYKEDIAVWKKMEDIRNGAFV